MKDLLGIPFNEYVRSLKKLNCKPLSYKPNQPLQAYSISAPKVRLQHRAMLSMTICVVYTLLWNENERHAQVQYIIN